MSVKIVIVSNRGPFTFSIKNNEVVYERGSGGLVTAISGVAREYDILWISCALSRGDREWLRQAGGGVHTIEDMQIQLVQPNQAAYQQYYNVISNPLLWFIQHQLHDTPRSPVIDEHVWRAWKDGYAAINRQLAEATAASLQSMEGPIIVMPQDYHLYLFPQYLRELVGDRAFIQSFLHIPWPGPDAWRALPAPLRQQLLSAMLHADRIGFQTERDKRRFLQTCAQNLKQVRVIEAWKRLHTGQREVEAAAYPISIDIAALEALAETDEVKSYSRLFDETLGTEKVILRVDRVEPSKNILRGIIAYRDLLRTYPEYRGKVMMLALLVPSRTEVAEYRHYLRDIMALVGELNATLGDGDWEPIRVMLGNNYARAIAAFMRYDVLLVNPLADGMNLVAKEGTVLNRRDGVLILSEEAGAAEELGDDALLVSPFDVYSTREALHEALSMPEHERRRRAVNLARQVRENDIHRWFARQIQDVEAASARASSS
ncbi:MAG: trehalose-6-phosphate synthase [Aggregatilineales bacterium]